MTYHEFLTEIKKIDPDSIYIVRIPDDTPQEKMLLLQKHLKQCNMRGIILPDSIKLEELDSDQIKYLLGTTKNEERKYN